MVGGYRDLVEEICHDVTPAVFEKIKQCLRYIELMGDGAPMNITRIVRIDPSGEPSSRDCDFSDIAIQLNQSEGYTSTKVR